ncbi:MAG TPA: hypothetical protein VHD56_16515 [Tepidisphaeraceae bacterium]|nr:hypothetical protein [Tepidisphaeraceae bacterium]
MDRELAKISIPIFLAAAVAATVVIVDVRHANRLINERPKPSDLAIAEPAPPPAIAPATAPTPTPQQTAPLSVNPSPLSNPTTSPVRQIEPPRVQTRIQPAQVAISEPEAREALAGVGSDPDAEAVWVSAINDTRLSGNQRRELIEDLNNTGIPNSRNITPDYLPIIENRLALIEQLAPDAIDDVNAAAFQEAYKDLINMRARLIGP